MNVGTAGLLFITDDGTTIRFYIRCTDGQTNCDYRWLGDIGGVGIGGTVRLNRGFYEQLLWQGPVTSNLRVHVRQLATNTQGLGGETSWLYHDVNRKTPPGAPPVSGVVNGFQLGWTGMTQTSGNFRMSRSATPTGGGTINQHMLRYGTDPGLLVGFTDINDSDGYEELANLKKYTRYYAAARAANELGWGPWSPIVSAMTLSSVPDQAPAPLFVSATATTISVRVNNPPFIGEPPYVRTLQLLKDDAFGTVLRTLTEPPQDYTFTNLTRGTRYKTRQRIKNKQGDGLWSDITDINTEYSAPSAPLDSSVYDVASTSAFISAGTLADNGGMQPSNMTVEYSAVGSTFISNSSDGWWGVTILTGLTANTQYRYRVRAYTEAGGWGPYSDWKFFTTRNDVPTQPRSVTATDFGSSNIVEWLSPTSLLGSQVNNVFLRLGTNAALTTGVRNFAMPAGTISQGIADLPAGTKFWARVWTTSTNGLGSTSALITFTTDGISNVPFFHRKVGGTWRRLTIWRRIGGTWRVITFWRRTSGVWRTR